MFDARKDARKLATAAAVCCFLIFPGTLLASTFYDWTASDLSGSTGFIEFDTTGALQSPSDFSGLPIIAGMFDFDGAGVDFLPFDIFAMAPSPLTTTTGHFILFSASSGDLVDGAFNATEITTANSLSITSSSVFCGAFGQLDAGFCGASSFQRPAPDVDGRFALRQSAAVPEPSTTLILALGGVAMAGFTRKRTTRQRCV